LEIPTGILADLWSRKWVVTLGHAISGLSFLVVLIAPTSFYIFVIWSVLSAICTALNSGTMTAIIYDSLKEKKKESEFFKVQSNITILILFSQTISIICGGWVANSLGFQYTLLLSAVSGLAQAWILAGIKEPKISMTSVNPGKDGSQKYSYKVFYHHFKVSIQFMTSNEIFRLISIFCILGFLTSAVFNNLLQPLIAISGLNTYLEVSLIIACINLLTMLAIFFFRKISTTSAQKKLFFVLQIFIAVTFFTIGNIQSIWLIILLALLNMLLEIYQLITNNKINLLIPSEKRATILSTQNQMNSLSYSFLALFIGSAIDKSGLKNISILLGFCFLLFCVLFFFTQNKKSEGTVPHHD
jgi:MFS family permease